MAVYLVTGKLGSGKSLVAVGKAREYAEAGRRVVANFHIDLAPVALSRAWRLSDADITVIPARPSSLDLAHLGIGGDREERAGLLILDECGTFLNSREWQNKDRQEVIHWLLHSRKLGWDVLLLIQAPGMLDKQVRESVCEFLVTCRRMDRMKVPILSWLLPWKVTWPRLHVAQVRYGLGINDPTAEHWIYRGVALFPCYATKWVCTEVAADGGWASSMDGAMLQAGPYQVLPARLTKWRYVARKVPLWRRGPFAPVPVRARSSKPKTGLTALLARLPEADRVRHWKRFAALGAFDGAAAGGVRAAQRLAPLPAA